MKSPSKRRGYKFAWLLLVIALTSCSALSGQLTLTATPTAESQSDTPTPIATEATAGPVTLSLWLPEHFDPSGGDLAATLLQDRLDAFSEQHPSVRIDMRLKAGTGPGGMLESLLTAGDAAPLAQPDLVLLHSNLLPPVVEAGLLEPIENLAEDWYGFARQMVSWNDLSYAWPFAGNALVTAYRPTAINQAPGNWNDLLGQQGALAFAAADSQALFATSQLLAMGADLDELESASLTELYAFIAQGLANGVFPFWLNQFESTEQSWQAFAEGRSPMVVAWSNRILANNTNNHLAVPLLSPEGAGFTPAIGWSWAATTPLEERRALVNELAAFLSEAEFTSQWSAAAGYLPARPSALDAWTPDERQVLARQLVDSAQVLPSPSSYPDLGPALREAVTALLRQEIVPDQAAAQTLEQLATP